MSDGSAAFYHRTLSACPCIWSILLGSAVLFPSDSDHSMNTISSPVVAMFFHPSIHPSVCLSRKTVRQKNVIQLEIKNDREKCQIEIKLTNRQTDRHMSDTYIEIDIESQTKNCQKVRLKNVRQTDR